MGLIGRIFGNGNGKEREGAGGATSTQFRESEPDEGDDPSSRNGPRRELIAVVLRDTMRKHGIPSDWIECRVLSTVSRNGKPGLHVNFVVKQAHDRLLTYVFAFQDSFERELARFEPRAREWLLSLAWEFQGVHAGQMPEGQAWQQSGPAPLVQPGWKAPDSGLTPLQAELAAQGPKTDDEIQQDLQALFAIRDAAMADASAGPRDQVDFQPTQPSPDDGTVKK